MRFSRFLPFIVGGGLVFVAPYALADSLRLPDAPEKDLATPSSIDRGEPSIAPEFVEKNNVILTPSEIVVRHELEDVDKTTNLEAVDSPSIPATKPQVIDNNTSLDSPLSPSSNDLSVPLGKGKTPGEIIIKVQDASDVQAVKDRPALSIEDILADPMKNNEKTSTNNDSLNLPKDSQKMDFLEGKWRCETDLINLENNTPVAIDFTFDKNGKGGAQLKEKNGRIFTGRANATMKNGVLNISVGELVTPESSARYNGSVIKCAQNGSSAMCSGKNTGNPSVTWNNATFKRVR